MPTRLYLSSTLIPHITPAVSSDWTGVDNHNSLSEIRALTGPTGIGTSMLTNVTKNYDAVLNHYVTSHALHFRFVSSQLEAQTITSGQSVRFQIQGSQVRAAFNGWLAWKMFLINSAGVHGSTIIPFRIDGGGTAALPTDPSAELFSGATSQAVNRGDSVAISAPVSVALGDRLVFEIGIGSSTVIAGGAYGHNATLRVGEGPGGTTDLPVNETEAGTAFRPWIEFTVQTILFQGVTVPEIRVTQQTIEGLADIGPGATGTLRVSQDILEGLADVGPGATGTLRVSQDTIEGLYDEIIDTIPTMYVTQDTIEGLWDEGDEPPEEPDPIEACQAGQTTFAGMVAGQITSAGTQSGQVTMARTVAAQLFCD